MPSPDRPNFTDEPNWEGVDLSKRRLLQALFLATPAALLACTPRKDTPAPEVTAIRRELGTWSQAETEFLARKMLGETDLNDVAKAGEILLNNQQGRPSFSKISPIFTDDKITFATAKNVGTTVDGVAMEGAALAVIGEVTPDLTIDVRSKSTRRLERIYVPQALRFESIQMSQEDTNDISDTLFQFFVAKEVYNAQAFHMVTDFIATNAFYSNYDKPQDKKIQNGIQASMMRSGIDDMPSSFMADVWAHFLLVPNYLTAIDQNRFTATDTSGDGVGMFKLAADVFQKNGILLKSPEGKYDWTTDYNRFYMEWIKLAYAGWNVMKPQEQLPHV